MRRFVAALIAVPLVFVLAGCSGGGEETAVSTDPAASGVATSPVDASAPTSPTAEGEVFEPFETTDQTPQAIADALAEKQAFILFFFDADQKSTNDVRQQIDSVVKDNTGLVELYTYNLGNFSEVDPDGSTVEVDEEALGEDSAGGQAVALARQLGVPFTPYLVVVDTQGYVVFRHAGFIDAELLEPQVQRAAE